MLSTIFISFIMIGVLSITAVLPVMQSIRDMYYRHKAAGMLNSRSVARSLATAEKKFIILSSLLFCAVFIPASGIADNPNQSLKERCLMGLLFWAFFAFNSAIYSYCGAYGCAGIDHYHRMNNSHSQWCLDRPTIHVFSTRNRNCASSGLNIHWDL